ncbi:divergent PAP2 family protein [Brevibacillus fluminis]|uniref:Divergent PAP2 family protein n=1 Tax=Brevibacillus fluminis TaxID=511487 RepID=A0A3M8D6W2_9BACL|nr:divergent PAP2 family protein [Brevibacillus fluminis]RNB83361.1 divergent PAP2 family protein [Brevibacillus fluminis]
MLYVLAPFIGWLVSGTTKFIINYLRFGKDARQRVGNGGFPSTHTTVMVTTICLIGLQEGFTHPVFGLGVAVTFIIIIDATGLRRAVGKHAAILNQLAKEHSKAAENKPLRESMGHTKWEIVGGIVLGALLAFVLHTLAKLVPGLLG